MKKNITSPHLRFQEFDEPWENKKLGEVLEIATRINTDNEFDKNSVLSVSDEFGIINQIEFQGRSFAAEDVSNYKKVYSGDIIYTRSPLSAKPFGIIKKVDKEEGILSPLYIVNTPKENNDSNFIYYRFDSPERTNNYLLPLVRKGAKNTMNISNEEWLSGNIIVAPSKKEQQEIGNFFTNIDNDISLHQKKLDKLKSIKKAYLKEMFPQNERLVPKRRFRGFTDNWKKSTIGEIALIKTGGTPSSVVEEYWFPKEIVWLSSGEVNKKYIYTSDDKISNLGYENSSATWIKKHSVLIALAGQGKTRGTVAVNEIPVTTNQSIAGIELKKEYDYLYLFFFLEGKYDALRQASSGDGTRGGLNKQILNDFEIMLPSYKEQKKIGAFFYQIDNQIINYQAVIEKLKKLKSAYLKEMFV